MLGRIKAHTQFVGPYEKRPHEDGCYRHGQTHGAEGVHEQGFVNMAANIQRYAKLS